MSSRINNVKEFYLIYNSKKGLLNAVVIADEMNFWWAIDRNNNVVFYQKDIDIIQLINECVKTYNI